MEESKEARMKNSKVFFWYFPSHLSFNSLFYDYTKYMDSSVEQEHTASIDVDEIGRRTGYLQVY